MLTSAFGASIAHSIATANGGAGTSSDRTRIGFWQLRMKSRVTVNRKSASVSNILVTNWSAVCIVISGRLAVICAGQPLQNAPWHLRTPAHRLCQHRGGHTIGCALQQTRDEGAANAETHDRELINSQMVH